MQAAQQFNEVLKPHKLSIDHKLSQSDSFPDKLALTKYDNVSTGSNNMVEIYETGTFTPLTYQNFSLISDPVKFSLASTFPSPDFSSISEHIKLVRALPSSTFPPPDFSSISEHIKLVPALPSGGTFETRVLSGDCCTLF